MKSNKKLKFRKLYHGTSKTAAELIKKEGFKASKSGPLGSGVYATGSKKSADFYRQQASAKADVKTQKFYSPEELKRLGSRLQIRVSTKAPVIKNSPSGYYLLSESQANKGLVKSSSKVDAPKGFKPARLRGAKPTIGYQPSKDSRSMPIKRGGQSRSNAGRYAPEGQGATQRGRNLPTPSGNQRPMQTARLPRAQMPGTVTSSGAARTASLLAQGSTGALSRLAIPLAIAAEVMRAQPAGRGSELSERQKKEYYDEAKAKRQMDLRNQQMQADKGSFDDAFSAARKAGRQDFSWRGRKYNTKIRGEG